MTEPTFGITITRDDNEARPVVVSDMSVVGLVGTAPAGDAAAFPLNTPVLVFSSDITTLAKLGATGTLRDQIALINAQLADFQVAAKVVVVRVAPGVDAAATMIMISDAVAAHVNRCFSIRANVKAAIATGTITTTAEIDAAFA